MPTTITGQNGAESARARVPSQGAPRLRRSRRTHGGPSRRGTGTGRRHRNTAAPRLASSARSMPTVLMDKTTSGAHCCEERDGALVIGRLLQLEWPTQSLPTAFWRDEDRDIP